MSGIYLAKGNLSITNSVLELKDNPSAITIASPTKNAVKQYGNNVIAVQSGEYDTAAEPEINLQIKQEILGLISILAVIMY